MCCAAAAAISVLLLSLSLLLLLLLLLQTTCAVRGAVTRWLSASAHQGSASSAYQGEHRLIWLHCCSLSLAAEGIIPGTGPSLKRDVSMHPQTATIAVNMTAAPRYYPSCSGLLYKWAATGDGIEILGHESGINVHLQRELVEVLGKPLL
jgi:hypothetical protein